MQTISELLAAIERLPGERRDDARARILAALEGSALSARAELGLLALDLIDLTEPPADARPA